VVVEEEAEEVEVVGVEQASPRQVEPQQQLLPQRQLQLHTAAVVDRTSRQPHAAVAADGGDVQPLLHSEQ
jgi:hypothetical protein